MANTIIEYKELRFVINDGLTDVYVLINVPDDDMGPASPQGWHHKSYPESRPVEGDIITSMWSDDGGPIMWPHKAPPEI